MRLETRQHFNQAACQCGRHALKRLVEQGDQTQNVILASGDLVYVPRRFWGDVNIFWKRIKPLFELVIAPARIVNEYDEAIDAFEND